MKINNIFSSDKQCNVSDEMKNFIDTYESITTSRFYSQEQKQNLFNFLSNALFVTDIEKYQLDEAYKNIDVDNIRDARNLRLLNFGEDGSDITDYILNKRIKYMSTYNKNIEENDEYDGYKNRTNWIRTIKQSNGILNAEVRYMYELDYAFFLISKKEYKDARDILIKYAQIYDINSMYALIGIYKEQNDTKNLFKSVCLMIKVLNLNEISVPANMLIYYNDAKKCEDNKEIQKTIDSENVDFFDVNKQSMRF